MGRRCRSLAGQERRPGRVRRIQDSRARSLRGRCRSWHRGQPGITDPEAESVWDPGPRQPSPGTLRTPQARSAAAARPVRRRPPPAPCGRASLRRTDPDQRTDRIRSRATGGHSARCFFGPFKPQTTPRPTKPRLRWRALPPGGSDLGGACAAAAQAEQASQAADFSPVRANLGTGLGRSHFPPKGSCVQP